MSITSCIFNCILRTWKEISYETINTFDLKDINVVVCSETSKGRSFQSKKFIQKSIWSKKKGRLRKFHGLHFKKKTKLDWKNALKQKSVMNSNEFDPFTGKCRKYLNSILIFTLFFIRFVRLLRNCPLDPYLISKWFVIPFGLTLFRCFLTFFFCTMKVCGILKSCSFPKPDSASLNESYLWDLKIEDSHFEMEWNECDSKCALSEKCIFMS